MTDRILNNRVNKMIELDAQIKELQKQRDAIAQEIQGEMQNEEEWKTNSVLVRWTSYIASRFDSKTFQAEHKSLYDQYTRQTAQRRFSYKLL